MSGAQHCTRRGELWISPCCKVLAGVLAQDPVTGSWLRVLAEGPGRCEGLDADGRSLPLNLLQGQHLAGGSGVRGGSGVLGVGQVGQESGGSGVRW